MTFVIRDFRESQLPILVRLLNDSRRGSYEFMPLTEQEVRDRIQQRGLRVLVAEEGGELAGAVTYNAGFWGEEIRWLAVREGLDRKSMEDALVKEAETLVQGETVFTSLDLGSPETAEWERRGYRIEGGLLQMIAKLKHARPIPGVPRGVILRSMRAGEEKAVVEMVNNVFGWERLSPDFVERGKRESAPFIEEWVQVAELEGKILSVVVASPAVKYNQHFSAKRGYLGPAATILEYRSKRLASALTVRAMNFLCEKGMDTAVLHTSEHNIPSVTLLRNLGFEVGHHVKFLRKNFQRTHRSGL